MNIEEETRIKYYNNLEKYQHRVLKDVTKYLKNNLFIKQVDYLIPEQIVGDICYAEIQKPESYIAYVTFKNDDNCEVSVKININDFGKFINKKGVNK